ncbi:hypothetical protein BVX97_05315 [bacterium E08(2017)]|nr:hypothetical protein BVX97_05315 [bacterium E08(2017)]
MPIDTKELMKQVGLIRVVTKRMVDEYLSGEYQSVFKGQGIEFDEVREYSAGDDVRSIDWNVTARMGHPYIKRYSEERELTIIFLVDISGSQAFGSASKSKAEVAAEISCLLAMSAIKNQDKVGLILFSDRIVKSIPPRKGRTSVRRIVREVLAAGETEHGTDIASALRFLNNTQKKKSVIFLISDFMDDNYDKELRVTAKRHDLICCSISDPREEELVDVGLIEIQDAETGELRVIDTSSAAVRSFFKNESEKRFDELDKAFRKHKIDHIRLSTDRPYIGDIRQLFHKRQTRH